MQIKLGKMYKKINSIERTMNAAVSVEVKLKQPTSEHDPVFLLKTTDKNISYNYAKWGDRRYWISEKVYKSRDIVELHCHLDVLGTFHDSIRGTTAFCSFADKAHWNKFLDDPRLGPEVELQPTGDKKIDGSAGWDGRFNIESFFSEVTHGTFVVKTFASVPTSVFGGSKNGLIAYAMDSSDIGTFMDRLCGVMHDLFNGTTNFMDVVKNGFTAFFGGGESADNIFSMMYIPLPLSVFASASGWTQIMDNAACIGPYWIETNPMQILCSNQLNTITLDSSITSTYTIPYAYITNAYPFLRGPKYTDVFIRTLAGQTNLSDESIINQTGIYFSIAVNIQDGTFVLDIRSQPALNGKSLAIIQGSCAIDLAFLTGITKVKDSADVIGGLVKMGAKAVAGVATYAMQPASVVRTNTKQIYNTKDDGKTFTQVGQIDETTETSAHTTNTGIAAAFTPMSSSGGPSVREASVSNSILLAAISKITNNKINFTLSVEHRFPALFMSDSGHVVSDGYAYELFCDEYGWPCNQRLMLSSLTSGTVHKAYVKCEGASWTPSHATVMATPEDISTVNSFLNSGIYISDDDPND